MCADGHKSRFDGKVLRFAEERKMDQFILWADASVACQKHNQINIEIHSTYD